MEECEICMDVRVSPIFRLTESLNEPFRNHLRIIKLLFLQLAAISRSRLHNGCVGVNIYVHLIAW